MSLSGGAVVAAAFSGTQLALRSQGKTNLCAAAFALHIALALVGMLVTCLLGWLVGYFLVGGMNNPNETPWF